MKLIPDMQNARSVEYLNVNFVVWTLLRTRRGKP